MVLGKKDVGRELIILADTVPGMVLLGLRIQLGGGGGGGDRY